MEKSYIKQIMFRIESSSHLRILPMKASSLFICVKIVSCSLSLFLSPVAYNIEMLFLSLYVIFRSVFFSVSIMLRFLSLCFNFFCFYFLRSTNPSENMLMLVSLCLILIFSLSSFSLGHWFSVFSFGFCLLLIFATITLSFVIVSGVSEIIITPVPLVVPRHKHAPFSSVHSLELVFFSFAMLIVRVWRF